MVLTFFIKCPKPLKSIVQKHRKPIIDNDASPDLNALYYLWRLFKTVLYKLYIEAEKTIVTSYSTSYGDEKVMQIVHLNFQL